jgi:hypothetical protein
MKDRQGPPQESKIPPQESKILAQEIKAGAQEKKIPWKGFQVHDGRSRGDVAVVVQGLMP